MTGAPDWLERRLLRPTVFEIDLDAVAHNVREIQQSVGDDVKIFAVLKCNAYGFGLNEVGEVVETSPAFGIAVGNLLEAVSLRMHGVTKPILVYANNLASSAADVVRHSLIPTVQDLDMARAYADAAGAEPVKVFVKVDVGLRRNGVTPEQAPAFCRTLQGLAGIVIDGIYTHLDVDNSEDVPYVEWQFARFLDVLNRLAEAGIRIPIRMASHSFLLPHYPHMDLNAVDPGKLVYGLYPTEGARRPLVLRQAFRALKTRLIARKTVDPAVSFDGRPSFPITPGTVIGVIPLGWGDGFPRGRANTATVLVRGMRVSVLGDVSVEHTRISLTRVPDAQVGDEVVVIGRQDGEEIALPEVADRCGIGLSELSRSIREPVARVFFKHGRPYKLTTILGETFAEGGTSNGDSDDMTPGAVPVRRSAATNPV